MRSERGILSSLLARVSFFRTRAEALAPTSPEPLPAQPIPVASKPRRPRGLHDGSLLLLDDDPSVLALLADFLVSHNMTVEPHSDPSAAITSFRSGPERFSMAVVDYSMPDQDGLEVLRSLRREDPLLPVVLMTGRDDIEIPADMAQGGALSRLLLKPFRYECLLELLQELSEADRNSNLIANKTDPG